MKSKQANKGNIQIYKYMMYDDITHFSQDALCKQTIGEDIQV
jgi:hypothetical protein